MTKTLPLTEVKARLTKLVTGVQERADEIILTKNGRPAAMLMNVDEVEGLRETLSILGNKALMRRLAKSRRYWERGGKGYTIEEVFGK